VLYRWAAFIVAAIYPTFTYTKALLGFLRALPVLRGSNAFG
jgi:hypothetical protein